MVEEWFKEIALEAELKTDESPELLELARELLGEDPDTRPAAIEELRAMVYERGECSPWRMDDAFLLRFLRARHFDVQRSYRLLLRYCRFLEQYPYLYKGVDLFDLEKLGNIYEGTIVDRPDVGRIVIMKFGNWDPSDYPIEELVKGGLALTEIGVRQPKLQVIGGYLIVDLEGVTLRHVYTLTPTVVYQIVCLTGLVTPLRIKSTHFINHGWILHSFLYMFYRNMSSEARRQTFFHGFDYKSLQQHIHPDCLPVRYGGTCSFLFNGFGYWLSKIRKYTDEKFVSEMKKFGYVIKE